MEADTERVRGSASWLWAAALAAITVVGGVARVVWLDGAPPALHFDEAVYGLMARQIGHGYWPVFFPAYTGREPLYMYLMAGLFQLLGSTAVTLRLTSALIGIATIPLLYLLGRELFDRRVGLIGAIVLAGNYWHLALSRNGYPNVLIPPIECLAMLFLWRGYRDRKVLWMAVGGLFAGLVLYTYLAARLFPVTVALVFLYVLSVEGRRFWSRVGGLALAVVAALGMFAPLGLYFLDHPHDFYERASQVLVFESQGGWLAWVRIMATNLARNLGGLFIQGDPRPLFNLPGKPVFTPIMAALFLLGLAVALSNWKRPQYGLLPIWLLGMCLPAILTDDVMPQSQRMSGAIPAIMLLGALGLERCWRWIRSQEGLERRIGSGLLIALLVLDSAASAYLYFGVWARDTANYYAFHAPYQWTAEDAAPYLAQGDTVVVISEHYRHPTAVFAAPVMSDALWLVANKTVVVPSRASGDILYYWPHHPAIAQPYIDERLNHLAEPVERALDPSGADAVDVMRLRPEALAEVAALQEQASVGEIAIMDWTAPESAPRDAPLQVELVWRVRAATTEGRIFSVHLVDAAGRLWSQHTDLGFMPEQWQPGDTVYQLFEVPLPEGIPAGTYHLEFVMADSDAVPFAVSVDGQGAGFAVDLGTVQLTAEGATVAPLREGIAFGDELRLVEHPTLADAALKAPSQELSLEWQAVTRPAADRSLVLQFVDAAGAEAARISVPLAGEYGSASWQPGELVQARYTLELPDLPAGRYRLLASVDGLEGGADLGTLVAEASLRSYAVPEMQHALDARLGDEVSLLGYDLNESGVRPGESLELSLYWRADAVPAGDAKVFVHLVDPAGTIRAQVDAVPVGWQRPTSGWRAGEVLTDQYTLTLPADAPAGTYTLYVGLYDVATLTRWPARLSGAAVTDDRLPIAAITVLP